MNIVVACDELNVARLFGAAECFTCYMVNKGIMSGCRTIPNPKLPAKDLAQFFKSVGVGILICDQISSQQKADFEGEGIEVSQGIRGLASEAASAHLAEALSGAGDLD